jgi:hypothetical protein
MPADTEGTIPVRKTVAFIISFVLFLGLLSIAPHSLPSWEQWLILAIPFLCFYLIADPRSTWHALRSIPSRITRVVGPIVGIAITLGIVFLGVWIIVRLIHWMWVNSPV